MCLFFCVVTFEYISGFFDADGSITMVRHSKSSKLKQIKIDFTNVERHILLEIQACLLEVGIKSHMAKKPARKQTHRESYSLTVNSNQHCISLCRLLTSRHPVKKHRITTILKYHDAVTVRNGKYTSKQLDRRLAYERLFFFPTFR